MPINTVHHLRLARNLPPFPHGFRKPRQHLHRRLPAHACVRDADALFQARGPFGRNLLRAFVDIRLQHDAYDARVAGFEL